MVKHKFILLAFVLFLSGNTIAQELEPRAYLNAPVDLNFLVLGYLYSKGGLIFDPSTSIENANSSVDVAVLAYVHTFDIAGMSAKAGFVSPYADLKADGYLSGNYRSRETKGLVDPAFFINVNFYGSPALQLKDYKSYQQDIIIGATFKVTAPFGEYEKNKLINIGTNRWSLKSELGVSKSINRWIVDGALSVTGFTDNDEYNINQTRQQDLVYAAQWNISYTFENKIWLSYGVTYFTGGEVTVNGVSSRNKLSNSRTGFISSIPIDKYNSVKVQLSRGLSTRTGTDYDSIGLYWQYRWGGGL